MGCACAVQSLAVAPKPDGCAESLQKPMTAHPHLRLTIILSPTAPATGSATIRPVLPAHHSTVAPPIRPPRTAIFHMSFLPPATSQLLGLYLTLSVQ